MIETARLVWCLCATFGVTYFVMRLALWALTRRFGPHGDGRRPPAAGAERIAGGKCSRDEYVMMSKTL